MKCILKSFVSKHCKIQEKQIISKKDEKKKLGKRHDWQSDIKRYKADV